MLYMSVTLDVSRLSGWLTPTPTAEQSGKHKREDVRAGRRRGVGRRRRMQRADSPDCGG